MAIVDLDPPCGATVRRLPPAFTLLDEELVQMAAGAPGKVGVLQLHFAYQQGRTYLAHVYATGPQRVQRVLHIDEALPDLAVAIVQSVGGGILQGDRLAIEISVDPGARALVTTQSATKVYRMEANYATTRIDARVADGGHLELLTDYIIPFAGVRLYNEIDLAVGEDATLIYTDGVAPGRVAFGESFAYQLLHTRLRAYDLDGVLRFADTTVLEPERTNPAGPGILGLHTDLASLYVVAPRHGASALADAIHQALGNRPGVEASASVLPHGDGVLARVLAPSSSEAQSAIHCAWRTTRQAVLSVDVPKIHSLKYGFEPGAPSDADL